MAQLENFRLKVFRTVAEHLNFRRAAEQLFLTQPAVTLQIKALENDVGARLFDRTSKGVLLTAQGADLLRYAKQMAALAAEAEEALGSRDGKFSGELALGVSTTIAQYVLPRLIGAFLNEHPRVRLALRSGNTREIVELIIGGKAALGLIEGPARDRGIRTEPLMQDELVLIAPADFKTQRVTPEELRRSTLLMREMGSGSRRVVESALQKAGVRVKTFGRVMNLDSTESIKSAVEAGLGIGFVSRWAISNELELGVLKIVEVRGLRITRHFSLVSRVGPELSGVAGAFRTFALERAVGLRNGR